MKDLEDAIRLLNKLEQMLQNHEDGAHCHCCCDCNEIAVKDIKDFFQ